MDDELPDDIDRDLWFPCTRHSGERDYLYNAGWHTFPGRMPAYCPTDKQSFRVSRSEMSEPLPTATKYWVAGFIVGNMPRQPDVEDDDPAMLRWEHKRARYFESGTWLYDEFDEE